MSIRLRDSCQVEDARARRTWNALGCVLRILDRGIRGLNPEKTVSRDVFPANLGGSIFNWPTERQQNLRLLCVASNIVKFTAKTWYYSRFLCGLVVLLRVANTP